MKNGELTLSGERFSIQVFVHPRNELFNLGLQFWSNNGRIVPLFSKVTLEFIEDNFDNRDTNFLEEVLLKSVLNHFQEILESPANARIESWVLEARDQVENENEDDG